MPGVVLVGGEALVDLVHVGDGQVRAHLGGGPFNTARAVARLGQPAAFLGRVSTDRFGGLQAALLAEDGVALDPALRTDDPTMLAVVEVDDEGVARYAFHTHGTAAAGLTRDDPLPEHVDVLHVGTLGLVLEPAADALEAAVDRLAGEALVMVDPNVRPAAIADETAFRGRLARVLARADVVKVSAEDLEWLDPGADASDAARALLAAGPAVVLLTLGAGGVLVLTRDGGEARVTPPSVQLVDTIGAGDSFGGGFIAHWQALGLGTAELADVERVIDAARFAVRVAARTCERPGAMPPRLDEL